MPAPEPRQLKITTEMLEKSGYSSNCARCRGILGSAPPHTRAHEAHCRKRMEAKLAEGDKFKEKLASTK
eukprot:90588-Heterocapsa_arctica.AAC.1